MNIPWSAPVAAGCNTAIGGQGQSGCMKPVCQRSSSELWISVCTMLKDASTLSWPSLGKQVLSSRDSCWLSSANGVVASLSPARAQQRYRLLSCPGSGVAAAVQQLRVALASKQLVPPAAKKSSLAAHCGYSGYNSSGQKCHMYCTVIHCKKLKIVVLI